VHPEQTSEKGALAYEIMRNGGRGCWSQMCKVFALQVSVHHAKEGMVAVADPDSELVVHASHHLLGGFAHDQPCSLLLHITTTPQPSYN
jgi:hypothetical protein